MSNFVIVTYRNCFKRPSTVVFPLESIDRLIFYENLLSKRFCFSPPHASRTTVQSPGTKKKKIKSNKDDPGSSDEERWLKAIETGKLDEVDDELKKITKKDPKMMTARQRAMFDRKTDNKEFIEELVALPSGMVFQLAFI